MAQSKTRTKAKPQTSSDNRKWLIRALIAVSVAINLVFLTLFILVRYTSYFDYVMLQMYFDRQIDGRGCIKFSYDDKEYGPGARPCLRYTVESPDGIIIKPDNLKGLRYFTDEEWKRGLKFEEKDAREN